MSESLLRLAALLSPAEYRSGQSIAQALGCTRAAVWKQVEALRESGVGVTAHSGKGYLLDAPLELLDAAAIRQAMPRAMKLSADPILVLADIDSTQAELLRRPPGERHGVAILAERQSAGRGRRGRHWYSPLARNVMLSLGWRLEAGLGAVGSLPLVVAIAVSRSLEAAGLKGHGIKWPNDLLYDERKLAGCLVEVQGDLNGPCDVVIGIGVNVHMPVTGGVIDQPWTELAAYLPEVTRNGLAALLLEHLIRALNDFEREGFEPFAADWARWDLLRGRRVELSGETWTVRGDACGIGPQGGLLLEHHGDIKEYVSGEVSARPVR